MNNKENQIKEMRELIAECGVSFIPPYVQIAESLYKAGYRKQGEESFNQDDAKSQIEEMYIFMVEYGLSYKAPYIQLAKALYDAGYRKTNN